CLCSFFFSSRRRHTRFSRDWSSDVCSSDLAFAALVITSHGRQVFDITTGLTTLPDGGRIYDALTDVEVEAALIEYVEGQYIDASDRKSVVEGKRGEVKGTGQYR